MGVTSGRGNRGGGRHGNGGRRDSGYDRTSLLGDGRKDAGFRGVPRDVVRGSVVPGDRAPGGWGRPGDQRAGGQAGEYGYADGGPGYGYGDGLGYGDGRGYGDLFAGERQAAGFNGGKPGRRATGRRVRPGRRRGVARWLGGYPAPVLSVVAIIACAVLVVAGVGVSRMLTAAPAADAADNPNCTIIVPANPLTAQGLATPYQLTATNPADGPCDEANGAQTAFVQGAVLDPATGQISVYNPVVVNQGTQPAVAPVVPALPAGAVVALWFGYNGNTLTLAGADENLSAATPAASAPAGSAAPTATASSSGTASPTPTDSGSATSTGTGSATPTDSATPADSASPTDTGGTGTPTATNTGGATPTATPAATQATGTPAATQSGVAVSAQNNQGNQGNQGSQGAGAGSSGATRASVQSVGSAPLPPGSDSSSGLLNATVTSVGSAATTHHHHRSPAPTASASGSTASASASGTAAPTAGGTATGTAAPTGAATATATASATANPADGAAAAPVADAILQQANCVAGENFGGQFSAFTQVGACNAAAFFSAANAAISAGKLTVPAPGTAKDGLACLTTRSFALIDQDQSDNVTSEYLSTGNGQIAQDNAANRASLGGAAVLFNGSDNGLLDLFVDPALGCSPWQVPNLADAGAPTTALPLDELQAAVWAGRNGSGPAALVPLNDPMTLDNNGNTSTDKTNTYRSLVDMSALPAGQSPATYCRDMETIQSRRLQQDVNLFMNGPSPDPGAASNLFMFLAMRLQQSYTNLNCGSFGMPNLVSTTADGNGTVVAACFLNRVGARTAGPGNPMRGTRRCPATTGGGQASASASAPAQGGAAGTGTGQPSASPSPTGMAPSSVRHYYRHHHHG